MYLQFKKDNTLTWMNYE